jgi:hypothetical protein
LSEWVVKRTYRLIDQSSAVASEEKTTHLRLSFRWKKDYKDFKTALDITKVHKLECDDSWESIYTHFSRKYNSYPYGWYATVEDNQKQQF